MVKLGSKRIAAMAALIGASAAVLEAVDARAQEEGPQNEQSPPVWLGTPPPDLPPPSSRARGYAANIGPQIGGRVGYTSGTGIVYSGLRVNDAANGSLPIVVDLGWRFARRFYAGFYGQFAPVFVATNPISCPAGFDCTSQDWRFGAEFDFHFVPRSRLDPYFGFGGGYEILHTSVTGPAPVPTPSGNVMGQASLSTVDRGWEFLSVTFGLDARVNPALGVGPFVSASLNEFGFRSGTQVVSIGGTQVSNGPPLDVGHGIHELYTAGVRGTFNP